jgi:hypothetical protein
MKEGWPCIPRKHLEKDATEKTSINNIANKISRSELFKLFF